MKYVECESCEYVYIYLLSNTIDLVHLELDECICVLRGDRNLYPTLTLSELH